MEINVKVTIDISERASETLGRLAGAIEGRQPLEVSGESIRRELNAAPPRAEQSATVAAETQSERPNKAATAPEAPEVTETSEHAPETQQSAPQTLQTPEEPQQAPEPEPVREYKEEPEDVMPLLRQRFGIPENKEERDQEQQRRAKALGKAVRSVIREVTKNPEARSLADLKADRDKTEFIRLALLITMDVNTGEFSTLPF